MIDAMRGLRLFFGLPMDISSIRHYQELVIQQFPELQRIFRWTNPESRHLTVRFMGSVPRENLPTLIKTVSAAIKDLPQFSVFLENIDLFPPHHDHLLVAKALLTRPLENLVKAVETAVIELGYASENRDYLPHITLGRRRTRKKFAFTAIDLYNQEIFAKQLILYESRSEKSGTIYLPVHRFRFK